MPEDANYYDRFSNHNEEPIKKKKNREVVSGTAFSLAKVFTYMFGGLLITSVIALALGYFISYLFGISSTEDTETLLVGVVALLIISAIALIVMSFVVPIMAVRNRHSVLIPSIIYTILMAIVSAAVYWGIIYLFAISPNGFLSKTTTFLKGDDIPGFTYDNGKITFDEKKHIGEDGTYFIFDSSVDKADAAYIDKAEITVDWSNGVQVYIFNGRSLTEIKKFGGTSSVNYADVAKMISLPNQFNKEGLIKIIKEKFLMAFLIVAGISLIWFIFKAFITGVIFGFVGFGIAKIVKLPWPYAE